MKKKLLLLALVIALALTAASCECPPSCPPEITTPEQVHTHSIVIDEAVAPTCTETGLTKGAHCDVCGEIFVMQEMVQMLDHIEVIDEAVPPTSTTPGLTEGKHCFTCKKVLVEQKVIQAFGNASKGLSYVLNAGGETYSVVGVGTCTDVNIIIPDTYKGKPVTGIDDYAFQGCTPLKTIVLPNSVTMIGISAFEDCTELESIVFSENIIEIGDYAFWNCVEIKSLALPQNIRHIGAGAFYDIVITINKPITEDCDWIDCFTHVIIADGITKIGDYGFWNFVCLENLTIPNSVTEIGAFVFDGCENLTSITFEGTQEEWYNIEFDADWKGDSTLSEIICVDGTINLIY